MSRSFFKYIHLPLLILFCGTFLVMVYCKKSEPAVDGVSDASTEYIVDENIVLPPPSETYEILGLVNGLKSYVVKYDDLLYRGGEPYSNDAVNELKKLGVNTIISITPSEVERFRCGLYGFNLIEIPFASTTGPSPNIIFKFVNAVKSTQGAFYLHSFGEQNRSRLMGVAYRVYINGWSPENAIREFGQLGGDLNDPDGMLGRLLSYQSNIAQHN